MEQEEYKVDSLNGEPRTGSAKFMKNRVKDEQDDNAACALNYVITEQLPCQLVTDSTLLKSVHTHQIPTIGSNSIRNTPEHT